MNRRQRKIIHIDMDAFFASVEQRENPKLIGKPIAVGGRPENRGVIATASYEARKFGVHSALSTQKAIKLCPDLILIAPNFKLYREIALEIREIFFRYTSLVEPISIDEAYLDVTDQFLHQGSATLIAKEILKEIKQQTNLSASGGISYNKFLAKYASDINKPAGTYTIAPNQAAAIIDLLPIHKFHGIGPATAKKLNGIGIFFGKDLRESSVNELKKQLGKRGEFYHQLAHGIDLRKVKTERITRSIGREKTFRQDMTEPTLIEAEMNQLLNNLLLQLKNKQLSAQTVTLKIKYANFKIQNKSYSERDNILTEQVTQTICKALLDQINIKTPIRLIGISFSNLHPQNKKIPIQLRLFH